MDRTSPTLLAAQPAGAAGRTAVRIPLAPSEWALVIAPLGPYALRPASACLTGPYVPPLPGRFTLVRVSWPAEPSLGVAVLHYRRGWTLTYSPDNQVTKRAARFLSVLAGQAIDSVLAGQEAGRAAASTPRITVTPVRCDLLPADLHPAAPLADGHDVTIFACSSLITQQLAEVLSILWTAHVRYLLHLSRPSTQTGYQAGPGLVAADLPRGGAGSVTSDGPVKYLCGVPAGTAADGDSRAAR